jgi:hypothetical protein
VLVAVGDADADADADADKAGSDQRIFGWKAHGAKRRQLKPQHVKKTRGMRGGGHKGFLACRSNPLFYRTNTQQKKASWNVSEDVFAQIC